MRVLSAFSNELCTLISEVEPANRDKELRKVTARFGDNVTLSDQVLRETMEKSFQAVAHFAGIIGISLKQSAFGRQIQSWSGKPEMLAGKGTETGASDDGAGSDTILADAVPVGAPGSLPVDGVEDTVSRVGSPEAILMAGIQDISNTLVEEFKLNDVLRIILETMYRAKGFKRVVLYMRDARNNTMLGRFGFGPDSVEVSKRFSFSLAYTPDIFHAALSKGVDILITDTNDPKIVARIPEWYRKGVNAGTFVIFPLCIKNNPVAMIYADSDSQGDIVIPEKELALLRTLRNQAVLAIKQSA